MKKFVKITLITILSLLAAYSILLIVLHHLIPPYVPPNVKYVEITLSESEMFTQSELADAAQTVKDYFRFDGCVLLDIWYDENDSDHLKKIYNYDSENIIILLSNFYVLPKGAHQSFNEDFVYRDWQWILVREDRNSLWIVKDFGYG